MTYHTVLRELQLKLPKQDNNEKKI